ncbi:ATP-binding protein [Dysgonomonas sp. 521]|uniref:ATP-binding protein n=1 Tax=Dysgonomonas sp. 521 TaxID=2302932 RepID=UPI0013D33AC3|nr:ATP-binding protein [Dysgonomonas sp. 521]NDV94241.1 ATP-binding protein [Dysgonomonas sp. 521]
MVNNNIIGWTELQKRIVESLQELSITQIDLSLKLEFFVSNVKEKLEAILNIKPLPKKNDKIAYVSARQKLNKLNAKERLLKYITFSASSEYWEGTILKGGLDTTKHRIHFEVITDFINSKGCADVFFEKMLEPINLSNTFLGQTESLKFNSSESYTEAKVLIERPITGISDIVKYSDSLCKKFLENNSSKYISEVFEERTAFIKSYNNFIESENNFYLLLGESGVGKTNIVCNLVELNKKNGNLVFAYDSNGLTKESFEKIEKLLSFIIQEIEKTHQKTIFFFDAINEATNYSASKIPYLDLLADIDNKLLKINNKNIKIIVSCRTFSWRDSVQHNLSKYSFLLTDENQQEIRYFTKEELLKVYPKYKQEFNLLTSVEQINTHAYATVYNSMLDPLKLRWIAEAYKGKKLPQSENELDYENLCIQKLQTIHDKQAYELIFLISKYLIENKIHKLHRSHLFNTDDEGLKNIKLLFLDEKSDYTNAGRMLIEANFLKKDTNYAYCFEFERIQEAMFAHVFVKEKAKIFANEPIPVKEYIGVYKEKEYDVVYNNFLRDALIKDFIEKDFNNSTIKELVLTNEARMQKLAYLTLSKLVLKHYNPVYEIIEHIIEDDNVLRFASKTTMDLIADLFIPNVYLQSKGNDKKPVALLQKIMTGSNSKMSNQLAMNIYIITRQNKEKSKEIINELFDFALTSNQLNIEYLMQLGVISFILSIDIVTQMNDLTSTNSLTFIKNNILCNWEKLGNKILTKELKIIAPNYKYSSKIINSLPLPVRNSIVKFLIKRGMMKYGSVQNDFVNNFYEFKKFWTDIPKRDSQDWSHQDFSSLTQFLNPDTNNIQHQKDKILKGYNSNNVFSYMLLERLLIIQGISNWNNVSDIIDEILVLNNISDYSKMSVSYVLFHIIEKSDKFNETAFNILSQITKEWCISTKGKFIITRDSKKEKYYKQHILNWYIVSYFKWHNYQVIDWQNIESIKNNIPVFIELVVDDALKNKNKDLLFYILENISIVATDFGYIEIAIQLFDFIVRHVDTSEKISNFKVDSQVDRRYSKSLPSFMSEVLCTLGNYYPAEVKGYIEIELYPNFDSPLAQGIKDEMKTKEEHEGLGGLLTHRFGNFFVWGCKNSPEVRNFFIEILESTEKVKNANQWAFRVFEKGVKDLINIEL